MTYALKFLAEGAVGPYSEFKWPKPKGSKPGKWVKATGELIACQNGVHATDWANATKWLNAECYVIELRGMSVEAGDKLCYREGRLVRRVESWNECNARLFAADCAAKVLPIFEKACPDDRRPREAIKAARRYAKNPTEKNRAARAAAGAAAWDAAWAAAWAAARDAARDAAWDAAWAAARAAARDAARDAAWDAAWAWQAKQLRKYIDAPEVES